MKPPCDGPLDNVFGQPDDGGMHSRVAKVEADIAAIKIDVAVIKAHGATKSDSAELRAEIAAKFAELDTKFAELRAEYREHRVEVKAEIAQGQNKMLVWIITAIFLAQLLPIVREEVRLRATERRAAAAAVQPRPDSSVRLSEPAPAAAPAGTQAAQARYIAKAASGPQA